MNALIDDSQREGGRASRELSQEPLARDPPQIPGSAVHIAVTQDFACLVLNMTT